MNKNEFDNFRLNEIYLFCVKLFNFDFWYKLSQKISHFYWFAFNVTLGYNTFFAIEIFD